jgi:hypothetical protein
MTVNLTRFNVEDAGSALHSSRRDKARIAPRFNAENGAPCVRVPKGRLNRRWCCRSAVPPGLALACHGAPNVKTLGSSHLSLRDKALLIPRKALRLRCRLLLPPLPRPSRDIDCAFNLLAPAPATWSLGVGMATRSYPTADPDTLRP